MRVLLASLLALSACVAPDGDESFIIRDNLAPEGDDCVFSAQTTSAVRTRGTLFLGSTSPYFMHPMFESRIQAPMGRESLRTILIKGAEVSVDIGPIEIIDGAGNVTFDDSIDTISYTSLFSASLGPNGGLSAATVDAVPLEALQIIRDRTGAATSFQAPAAPFVNAQVLATVTAFGDYYGEELEASPYTFPVTVCNGCTFVTVGGQCGTIAGAIGFVGDPCNPFQDAFVNMVCCDDDGVPGGTFTCPAN